MTEIAVQSAANVVRCSRKRTYLNYVSFMQEC